MSPVFCPKYVGAKAAGADKVSTGFPCVKLCAKQICCSSSVLHSVANRKGDFHPWVKNTMKLQLSVWTAGQRPNPRTLEDLFDDSPSMAITITINSLFFEINITPRKS